MIGYRRAVDHLRMPGRRTICSDIPDKLRTALVRALAAGEGRAAIERAIVDVAASQFGLITTGQLFALGLSRAAISERVKLGRLHRVHWGVYAVGRPDLARNGVFLAAVLAIGEGAVLSGFAGAALHDFWTGATAPIDVTVARSVRSRSGIRVHAGVQLPAASVTIRFGIPVTSPAWTILDLAAVMYSQRAFRRLVHEAQAQGRVTPEGLHAEIERAPRHRGAPRVLAEIADGYKPTRSGLEDDLLDLLRRDAFPPFETNARVPGCPDWVRVDFLFRTQKVVIEVDGDRWHNTSFRREFDANKRATIEAAGYRVVVLVDDDLELPNQARTTTRIRHAVT